MRAWWTILAAFAGLFGAGGVALAAAGAHLSGTPIVTTAAYFLLFHAAALVGLCSLARGRGEPGLAVAASLIVVGATLFSGDLALRGLAGRIVAHMAAPTGGMSLILGWLVASVALPVSVRRASDA